MRSDYALRLLVEDLQRKGASEQAIVRAVRDAAGQGDTPEPSRPRRRTLRSLRLRAS